MKKWLMACRCGFAGPFMLAWLLLLASPQAAAKNHCAAAAGARIFLPPSVSFILGQTPPVGTMIYQSQEYSFPYTCDCDPSTIRVGYLQPPLTACDPYVMQLGDLRPLLDSLKLSGLRLNLIINGLSWNPDALAGGSEYLPLNAPYAGPISAVLKVTLQLFVVNKPLVPQRFFVAPATAFKVTHHQNAAVSPGAQITTSAITLQFFPDCFGAINIPDTLVKFDRVIATSSNASGLPQERVFRLEAGPNGVSACADNAAILKTYPFDSIPQNPHPGGLFVELSVGFRAAGGERLGNGGNSIILRNADGTENGLQMEIINPLGAAVSLQSAIDDISLLTPAQREAIRGNFGAIEQGRWASKQYFARLSQIPGATVIPGNYSTQVIVQIYYL